MNNYDPTYEENNDVLDDVVDGQGVSANGTCENVCIGRVGAPLQK